MTSSHQPTSSVRASSDGDDHHSSSVGQQLVSARASSHSSSHNDPASDAAAPGVPSGPCMNEPAPSALSSRSGGIHASPQKHSDDSDSDQDDAADNNDPESLSASFLSQLRSDPRTPTARYSFDDHHDYFHRLEFEALVQQQQQQQQPADTMATSTPPGEAAVRSSSSSSSSRDRSSSPASASTAINADQTSSRPKLVTLDSGASASLSSVKTRKRSNSADGTVSYASFRNGRYVARPRHAHPGPPSLEQIVRTVRGPQPSDRPGSSSARPRSNSRSSDHGPIGWSQRGNMAMFADAGIPGTSFPHPDVLGAAAVTAASQAHGEAGSAADFENTIQPWDSPRIPARALAAHAVPAQPVPLAATKGRVGTSHSIDGSDLASNQLRRNQSRASRAATDAASLSPPQDQPSGPEDDGVNNQDKENEKEKPTFKERCRDTVKSIRLSSNYFALYKAADRTDVALLVIGIIAAIGSGVPLPLIGILFGQLIDGFNSASCGSSSVPTDKNAFLSSVDDKVGKIAIIAAVNFFLIWTYTTCWSNLGERLVRKMRQRYLAAVLRQDMAFFDTLKPGEVGTRLSADLLTIQNGTSEKMGILISSLSYFVTSYIVAFIKLPRLAGQLVSLLPAFGIVSIVGSRFVANAQKNTSTHLSHAASLAAEALNNLPVVQAFGAQKRLSNIYQSHLERARRQGTLKALAAACVLGALFFVGYSANALAFFSGSNLIASSGNPGTVGSVYTVIFLLLDASFIVGQIAPYLQTFSAASGAGQALRETIDKVSPIDATNASHGIMPQPGDVADIAVELKDVEFSYPARPDEKALHGLSISVPAGHRVALVGLSGSGKSTVAALLQRFYDPTSGRVLLNGTDVREYNVRWLRSQIGVVGQEPVLFDCSIMQSIAHGLVGSPAHSHLHETVLAFSQVGQEKTGTELEHVLTTSEQLEQLDEIKALCVRAAKLAGAHNFIERLPQGYDSQVGEAGGKLSGGQKQRISIARAIVKQPKLLILDEATAALDSHSEHAVAKALDSISEGVTTVAIAHRLATIRNYDQIVVMGAGKVLEQGTHKQLLALRGYYYKLAAAQDTGSRADEGADETDADSGVEDDLPAEEVERRTRQRMDDVAEGDESEGLEGERDESNADSLESSRATLRRNSSDDAQKDKAAAGGVPDEPTEKEATEAQIEQHKGRYPPRVILRRVLWLVRREWAFILLGLFTSTIMGGSYSGEAVLFGHVIEALNPQCHSPDGVRSSGREFARYFFILALIQLVAYSINGLVWGLVAERLLFRLRRVSFNTMMHQRLTWFEAQDQNPASMIASLSNDANNLGGVTGTVIGTIFCIFVNLLAGIIVSHAIAWRIAVVILALVPIILTAGYLRLKVLADFQKRHETAYIKSNALAIEAVQCIRTVASLGREDDVMRKFERSLQKPYRESMRHFLFGNVFLALALSISYFIYAFAYWWGSQNIAEGRYSQTAFFIVLPALLFSAQASGQLLAFAPDFSKAHVSAANFFRLMDQRPEAVQEKMGKDVEGAAQEGGDADAVEKTKATRIEFADVSFTYPTREEAALKKVSLTIEPGCFAAFVGQSGSGKTTAMSLIENFYTPTSGCVRVDGLRTDRTSDAVLRRDMAIVPQEPVIFYGTVRFNVLLGLRPDMPSATAARKSKRGRGREEDELLAPYREDVSWQTSVSDSDIEAACKAAGIHETIMSFRKGYDTLITSSQLSGGQKQRLSIARALIRKPRLLLLDESTSALDSHSEQAFQQTLDAIRSEGKCTILAIAHRMRTIKDADKIFLFENGQLEAQGAYAELVKNNDSFKAMVAYQSLN